MDRQELFAVLAPVLGDVRCVVDGRREVWCAGAAGGFIYRVAEPYEVIEVALAEVCCTWGGVVGTVGCVVRTHQTICVTGKAEPDRDVFGRARGRDKRTDLANRVVVRDETVKVPGTGFEAGRVDVDCVIARGIRDACESS